MNRVPIDRSVVSKNRADFELINFFLEELINSLFIFNYFFFLRTDRIQITIFTFFSGFFPWEHDSYFSPVDGNTNYFSGSMAGRNRFSVCRQRPEPVPAGRAARQQTGACQFYTFYDGVTYREKNILKNIEKILKKM